MRSLVLLLLLATGCAPMVANSLMHPMRQTLPRDPGDYGMEFQDVSFRSADGVDLAAWYIPAQGEGLVILTHPGNHTRYGYAADQQGFFKLYDQDVQFLPAVRHLHEAGYSVLLFDFRNHGASGQSPNGGITGVGLFEYQDVAGAFRWAAEHPDLQDEPVGLLSFCQGANASLIAMSKEPEALGALRAVVAVQPISGDVFSRSYAADVGVPRGALRRAEERMIAQGAPALDDQSPLPYASDAIAPVLLVQALDDPWTELHYVRAVYDALPQPKDVLWLEEPEQRFDSYNWFNEHPEPMLEWFEGTLRVEQDQVWEPEPVQLGNLRRIEVNKAFPGSLAVVAHLKSQGFPWTEEDWFGPQQSRRWAVVIGEEVDVPVAQAAIEAASKGVDELILIFKPEDKVFHHGYRIYLGSVDESHQKYATIGPEEIQQALEPGLSRQQLQALGHRASEKD